jgi:hypothetical protein
MSISATTGRAVYSGGANAYNGTTVAGARTKVANAITSTAVGIATYPAGTTASAVGFATYNDATATQRKSLQTVTGQPTPGSIGTPPSAIGKAVYSGIYS